MLRIQRMASLRIISDPIGPAGILLHIVLQHHGQNGPWEVEIPRSERKDSENRGSVS